ncbi:MAG: hypothetical protein H7328_02380 [Bdellovibrio sp.]|nr:hypothetical protein [Bdellovibrio sp.]
MIKLTKYQLVTCCSLVIYIFIFYQALQFLLKLPQNFIEVAPNVAVFIITFVIGTLIFISMLKQYWENNHNHNKSQQGIIFKLFIGSFIMIFVLFQTTENYNYILLVTALTLFLQVYLSLVNKYFSLRNYFSRPTELASLLFFPLLLASGMSAIPLSKSDRLFRKSLLELSKKTFASDVVGKVEGCEKIKFAFKLKPRHKEDLDQVCTVGVMNLAVDQPTQLQPAFKWLFEQYTKKPTKPNSTALACIYAEMGQLPYALQITEANKLAKLHMDLKNNGRCATLIKRKIASATKN